MNEKIPLEIGIYTIPEGCVIDKNGLTLEVRKSKVTRSQTKCNRCRQCKFFKIPQKGDGHRSPTCRLFIINGYGEQINPHEKHVAPWYKACDKFQPKKPET